MFESRVFGHRSWQILRAVGLAVGLLVIARLLYEIRPFVYATTGEAPLWPFFVAGYFLGTVPALWSILLVRRAADVKLWELIGLVAPFLVWFVLPGRGMSLANVLLEPIYLGLAISVIYCCRVILKWRAPEIRWVIGAAFLSGLLAAVAFGLFFPVLPE